MNYRAIKDGAIVYSGFAFKRADLTSSGDIPVIKIGNLVDKTVDYSKTDFFSYDLLNEKVKKYFLDDRDVLIAMTGQGSVGRVAQLRKKKKNDVLLLNQRVGKFVCNPQKLDNDYLFYVLSSSYFQEILFNLGYGSGQPNLSPETILNVLIPFPNISTQKNIASLLSSFDDKIALNTSINENLEQQAQAIFKSWFVDFEPFGGVMPSDWRVGKNSEIPMLITDYVANGSFALLKKNVTLLQKVAYAYFIRNTDLKSNSFNTYVDEHSYNFLSKSSLFGGEIISNVGDVGSVFLCPKLNKPMTLGNNIIMIRPEMYEYQYFLYIWFKWGQWQNYIQGIKGGSAQPKFNKTDFKNLPIMIPSKSILKEFHFIIKVLFEKINLNQSENSRLSTIRDTLFPKLLNGEIDVSKIKI